MTLVTVLLITSQPLFAQRGMGHAYGGGRGMRSACGRGWTRICSHMRQYKIPNLTPDQIAKIQQLQIDFQNGIWF